MNWLIALAIFPFLFSESHADLVDPAPHVEQEVNWRIGQMRADPILNLVYIVNETEDKILALNTETGQVDATVTVGDAVRDGHLEFSIDGTKLYLSTPHTTRLHVFSTGTLAFVEAIDLPFPVRSFSIGSDGFLYAIKEESGWDQLTKIVPATGAVSGTDVAVTWDKDAIFFRNESGSRIFLMTWTNVEIAPQTGAMPPLVATHANSGSRDLAFDEPLNTLYGVSGGTAGLKVRNITAKALQILVKPSKKLKTRKTRKIKRKKFTAGYTVTSTKNPSLTDSVIGVTKTK